MVESALVMTWPRGDGLVGVTAEGHEVRIEYTRGIAATWVVLCAPICRRDQIDPELALERNARLALATIAIADGVYWLRVAVPLDSAELSDPRQLFALLIDAARSLDPRRTGEPITSTAFDHYTG